MAGRKTCTKGALRSLKSDNGHNYALFQGILLAKDTFSGKSNVRREPNENSV